MKYTISGIKKGKLERIEKTDHLEEALEYIRQMLSEGYDIGIANIDNHPCHNKYNQ